MRTGPATGARVLALAAAGALLATALASTGVAGALPQMYSADSPVDGGGETHEDDALVPMTGAGELPMGSLQAWCLLLAWLTTPALAGAATLRNRQ